MSTLKYIGLALLALGLSSSSASANAVVETYTAVETYDFVMPGIPNGPGVDFGYTKSTDSIDFMPGDVSFGGTPIDFDGTEAAFIATSQSGTVHIPVSSGPATVPATGDATFTGPALVGGGIPIEIVSLELGGGFSPINLDIVPWSLTGTHVSGEDLGTITVPVVPELNGAPVEFEATSTVVTVDPVTGTFTVTTTGQILASPTVPMLSGWRVLLLVATLLGAGAMIQSRRLRWVS